jgi:hypothetical protein
MKTKRFFENNFLLVVICYHNNHYIHVCFHHQVNAKQPIVLQIHMIVKSVMFGNRFFALLIEIHIYLIRLLGTSGQNLDDIDLQSTIDNRVQILENCLKWGVIAPTCPDTLSLRKKRICCILKISFRLLSIC